MWYGHLNHNAAPEKFSGDLYDPTTTHIRPLTLKQLNHTRLLQFFRQHQRRPPLSIFDIRISSMPQERRSDRKLLPSHGAVQRRPPTFMAGDTKTPGVIRIHKLVDRRPSFDQIAKQL